MGVDWAWMWTSFVLGPKNGLDLVVWFWLLFMVRIWFSFHKDHLCNFGKVEGWILAFSKFVSKGIKCQ